MVKLESPGAMLCVLSCGSTTGSLLLSTIVQSHDKLSRDLMLRLFHFFLLICFSCCCSYIKDRQAEPRVLCLETKYVQDKRVWWDGVGRGGGGGGVALSAVTIREDRRLCMVHTRMGHF